MSQLLGHPLEVSLGATTSAQTGGGGGGSSSPYGSSGSSSGGAGASGVAGWHVTLGEHSFMLVLDIAPAFPEEQPRLTLHNLRWGGRRRGSRPLGWSLARALFTSLALTHCSFEGGGQGPPADAACAAGCRQHSPSASAVYAQYPWSPRWSAAEMAARMHNFVRGEAATLAAKLSAAG